jgi:hypothetical protein
MSPLRDLFEQQYKTAAAEGALYELRLRLLADKVAELRSLAHAPTLIRVEARIVKHFASVLTKDEKEVLILSLELRNRILHCNFRAARNKLQQMGVEPRRGNVKKVDVAGLSRTQMVEKIESVAAGVPDAFSYVADSISEAGSVFGWLLELGQAGDFIQAVRAFERAAAIVDRLAAR